MGLPEGKQQLGEICMKIMMLFSLLELVACAGRTTRKILKIRWSSCGGRHSGGDGDGDGDGRRVLVMLETTMF